MQRQDFDAFKESRIFLLVLTFAFIPYVMNYVYLISGIVDLDLLTFETYFEIGFFISILAGLFYWPLGIMTGYGCLYALLF
jgi:membrane protein DedA with SNARE-associated domain